MEPKPGSETSEFKLTLLAIIIGTVAEGAAGVLHALEAQGVHAGWFNAVLVVAGVLMQVAALFGYQKARAVVKSSALLAAKLPESSALPTPPERPSALPPP